MRKIGRNEPGPTRAEIGWRHREMKQRVIKHENGDFTVEHNDWDGLTHKPRTDREFIMNAKEAKHKQPHERSGE